MTIEKDKDTQCYVVHCDTCTEHLETEEADFEAARATAKAKRWRAYIGPDKEWANSCPSCTSDFGKRQRGAR